MRRTTITPLVTTVLAVVLAMTTVGLDGGAMAQGPDEPFTARQDVPGVDRLTLVTGDVVTVEHHPDGRRSVSLEDEDEGVVDFETFETSDGFHVVPLDAAPLVPSRLDPALFNIDKLTATEEHAGDDQLPVVVQYDAGMRRQAARPAAVDRNLASIDAVAATLDPDAAETFWDELVGASADTTTPQIQASTNVERVWLDEVVTATLDDSVPQVGAPSAWDAGYDGQGATVAVLDTGVDVNHPDLAGQVTSTANFSTDTPGDGDGHGTHVASTVAGTGAGSDGLRPGVAPGAEIIAGKVLDDNGDGLTSWVIAGMEWATLEHGADIVNLSLGSGPTDGTDPLSLAVDQLTEATDTLFVAAAGNLGSQSRTIGSPAAADSAVAVGAVWGSDFLWSSSSRGPRRGDHAIKPDLTAPGVNIVAARAEGTAMGTPVDDLYTQASGTSMAAPHVAGAAAILSQQRPDWGVEELTAALVTTADPHGSFNVYEQGGGRLDVAAATTTPVLATPAPLDLGYFPYPQDDAQPVTRDVTYTNVTDAPMVLDLSLAVTDEEGDAPADGMIAVSPDTVTLDPGGTATASVTVDVAAGDHGLYGGNLIAASDGVPVVRTPVGFHKEDERYELSIRGLDAHGEPATGASSVGVLNVDDSSTFFESGIRYIDGVASVRVPPGTYAISGMTFTYDDDAEVREVSAMAAPEFTVTDDTEVLLDARTANEITVDTPAHDTAPRIRTDLSIFRAPATGAGYIRGASFGVEGRTFSAVPTEPVTTGDFEFVSRWQLADPDHPIDTPVLYDVLLPEAAIPEDLGYEVRPEDLATSHQRFHAHVPDHPVQEFRTGWRPWRSVAVAISEPVPAPGERTDYLSPGDTRWTRTLLFAPPDHSSFAARMNAPRMEYEPGSEQTRSWFEQPATPSLLEGSPWHRSFPQYREGDVIEMFIPEYGDTQRGHWSWSHGSIDEVAFRVHENGELIGEASRARGSFDVSPEPSTVRFELDTARTGLDWWRYSTRTHTAWTVETSRPQDGDTQLLPLLFVDYDLNLDLLNRAPHPRDRRGPPTIDLTVRHQPGLDDAPAIDDLELHTSADDGDTWRRIDNVRQTGPGQFRAILDTRDPSETNGYVALKVRASDVAGNAIEQEIERAFGLPDRD